jgi:hypothetical protein
MEVGGRDSIVGIVTPFGLQNWGSNPGGGPALPHSTRPAIGPTQPSVQSVPGLSRG